MTRADIVACVDDGVFFFSFLHAEQTCLRFTDR